MGGPNIETQKMEEEEEGDNNPALCHDDSSNPMKAQTIDQLHSLQMKKSQPGTPLNGSIHGGAAFASLEKERQIQQLNLSSRK
ncbi:hypothetical protein Leryth_015635 [Lithospermum erythrorhizon]|nr:hypothetical protein Leryth_015635 [Lithospermum erythrorhizon]